jgi:prolyl-tRNA editing enzyme YbaK/EbsC (Cys-tRNA(Pro) deacylase)
MADTLQSILDMLADAKVDFRTIHHPPTRTSEESAVARGEELKTGGKALLLKLGTEFRLFVMPADHKLNSKVIKKELGFKKVRFATPDELMELTDLVPGSVPPFGEPILPFPLYADTSIASNEKIAFNAGSLTDSVIMQVSDYLRLAKPTQFSFTTLAKAAT